ncbi:hypothetical protein BDY21DRAFT_164671 [Lineolata rhizophorae]|uniref:Uncharacterized protein n=1 Tax=Lineolata rhizophorae TaxID=578093 RepID=A0A6A6P9G6_9PEZI|nr:hypothetical protein BDY21DRAFT_164671 [Lineolata rhizophorae]
MARVHRRIQSVRNIGGLRGRLKRSIEYIHGLRDETSLRTELGCRWKHAQHHEALEAIQRPTASKSHGEARRVRAGRCLISIRSRARGGKTSSQLYWLSAHASLGGNSRDCHYPTAGKGEQIEAPYRYMRDPGQHAQRGRVAASGCWAERAGGHGF